MSKHYAAYDATQIVKQQDSEVEVRVGPHRSIVTPHRALEIVDRSGIAALGAVVCDSDGMERSFLRESLGPSGSSSGDLPAGTLIGV